MALTILHSLKRDATQLPKDSLCSRHPLCATLNEASVACSTKLHCGGTKAFTGRGECNRAAPDAQRSANEKKDSLTIRDGMACKMIA